MEALFVCIASIIGTLLRWLLAGLFDNKYINFGTLLANLIGCLLIGILLGLAKNKFQISESNMTVLKIGFLGSLTTFSGFSLEAVSYMIAHQYGKFFLIIVSHVIGCLTLTYLGYVATEIFLKTIKSN